MAELLNLARMARRAGVTAQWLRDAADQGIVPSLRAGRRYVFNPEAVTAALSRLAAESSSSNEGGSHE
jgi:hypothetical protein